LGERASAIDARKAALERRRARLSAARLAPRGLVLSAAAVAIVAIVVPNVFAPSREASGSGAISMAAASVRARAAPLAHAGRRAIVVGGTSGIGHGVALRLAESG
jgi:NAD(P)-dependent dehydrogenase (short-subunit alcohol dehydrogenase family)